MRLNSLNRKFTVSSYLDNNIGRGFSLEENNKIIAEVEFFFKKSTLNCICIKSKDFEEIGKVLKSIKTLISICLLPHSEYSINIGDFLSSERIGILSL